MTIRVPTGRVEFGPLLEVQLQVRTTLRRVSSPSDRAVLFSMVRRMREGRQN